MTIADPERSVVVPVYGNRDSLPELIRRMEKLTVDAPAETEVVFVVDGSPDDSSEVLSRELAGSSIRAQVIELSRNFGSLSATRTGLRYSRGRYVAVIAADLQEPPELVDEFFTKLASGECDIVIGNRVGRDDAKSASLAASSYWNLYRRLINKDIPSGGVDVFGCTREVADALVRIREQHTSLVGLLFWVGYRRDFIDYERTERHSGKSGWTFRKKLRYMMDSIYAFTDLPLILLQVVGVIGIAFSLTAAAVVLAGWAMGLISEAGYTPLMITLLAATSALLLGMGVVGSYVWRAYENGKNRPLALVRKTEVYGE
jgi:glycosyltransferase involved in cell wall biosynthesis